MRKTTHAMLLMLLASTTLTGCGDFIPYMIHLFEPPDKKKIKPEYPLKGKTVAVAIFTDESTQYEYPNARLTLGAKINNEMENNIKDLKVISTTKVSRYQDENINWDADDKRKMGKNLKADFLLLVSISEYSTREPGQMNAYQGRISADAKLYECSSDDPEPVWESEEQVEVVFPENALYSAAAEGPIRNQTEKNFAEMLSKKFYKHTIEVERK